MANIFKGNIAHFRIWDPDTLDEVSDSEIHVSNTFLSINPVTLLEGFDTRWQSFLKDLGHSNCIVTSVCRRGLIEFPSSAYEFSFANESAYFVISSSDKLAFSRALPNQGALSKDETSLQEFLPSSQIFLEYFFRRFLWSVKESWIGSEPLDLDFRGEFSFEPSFVFEGDLLDVSVNIFDIKFGFSILLPSLLYKLIIANAKPALPFKTFSETVYSGSNPVDLRSLLGKKESTKRIESGGAFRVSAEFSLLHLDPSSLIDFLRPEAIIILDKTDFNSTFLINQEAEILGSLAQCDGDFVLKFKVQDSVISNVLSEERNRPGLTSISVILFDESVDYASILSSAIFYKSQKSLSPNVSLLIGGEIVADGVLGWIDGKLAVKVLARD